MKKPRILSLALAVLMVLGLSTVFAGCSAERKTIRIGAILPMTGDVSVYGVSTANAIKIAVEEINKAGGINGKQVELVLQDDENKPDKSIDCYKNLTIPDKVDAIIGSVTSQCTLAIAPLAQKDHIPLITPASTNEQVTQLGDYIFRACFVDSFQGAVCAKFAAETLKKTTAAIMFDSGNDYSKGLADEFEKAFVAGGGVITDKETYTKDDTDFFASIINIMGTDPEVIFLPDYYAKDALLAGQIRAAGMTDNVLIGGDGWEGVVGNAGPEVSGAYFSNHYTPDATDPDVVAFVDKYRAAYNGETPDAPAALGYDAMEIVAAAIKSAGSTDSAKVRDAIANTNGKFVTGNITYDAGRNPVKPAVIVAINDGWGGLTAEHFATVNP